MATPTLLFKVTDGKFQSGEASTPITGEAELAITQDDAGGEQVQLVQLNLYSPGLISWRESTGDLNIIAQSGQGQVREGQLQMNLVASIQFIERKADTGYPAIAALASTRAVFPQVPFEDFDGTLVGVLEPPGADGARVLKDAKLSLTSRQPRALAAPGAPGAAVEAPAEGAGGAVESLSLTLSAAASAVPPAAGCPADRQVNVRTLTIQPVFFAGDVAHPLTTGGTFDQQVATARAIWARCCIELDVMPPVVLPDAQVSQSGDVNAIITALPEPKRRGDAVRVFVVENHLPPGDGGGLQFASDIVLTDDNVGNPTLLAHELGHVFGLAHEAGDIMQPSGSPHIPSPANVSLQLCHRITLAKLKTGASACISAP